MKILRKFLLGRNIESESSLIPVPIYLPRPGIDFRKKRRFALGPKPIFALVMIAGLMSSFRAMAANPTLSNLTISNGTLSPAFASGTNSYTAMVSSSTGSITVTPTVPPGGGTITVNGATVGSGNASGPITLNPGTNTPITIIVTKGANTGTYTITVTRESLSYSGTPFNYATGTVLTTQITPTSPYGVPTGYTISPTTLPAGLTFAPGTGVISGTPTTTTAATIYTITATYAVGITATATISLQITGTPQTISFTLSSPQVYGTSPITLNGTATSGLTVSYNSSNTSVATVSGSTLTIVGVGTTTITASQAGNGTYGAATNVTQTLTVTPLTITISGLTANNKTYDGTTSATFSGTGLLSGVISGDVVSYSSAGTFASANVGSGIGVTVTLNGAAAGNYTLTQPGLTANITGAPLTLTATGPTKTYGTTITTGTSTINFTASGAVSGQAVTSVTLTADANGQTANTPVLSAYVVTPSAPTGTGGFLASNYIITPVTYNGTVTAAALTITATGPSLGFGTGFTNGSYTTNFVTTATAISGEIVTNVTLTSTPAITATTAVGTGYTITPSAPTGSGGFLASNYTITYVTYSDVIRAFLYNWAGAGADNNWTTTANWSSSPSGGSFPQTSFDDVQIGVVAYTGTQQPVLNATEPISSLTFGTNGSTGVTLTINTGNTLTISSDITVNSGASTTNLANNGAIVVHGGYTNNTGAKLNASASTGSLSIAGTYNNSGSSTWAGTVSITGTYNNVGTSIFGAGATTINGQYNNSGTNTFGSGAVTFANAFTNTAGTTTFGTGLATFSSNDPSAFLMIQKGGSITFNNVAFTGGGNYHFKTITSGNGIFNLSSTGVMTLSNGSQVGPANAVFNLLSDANGSATIATLPAGCQIVGNAINVQRYIAGGVASARGYRLLSPPVYTGSNPTSGNNIYSISYLLNSTYISGTQFPSTASNSHSKTGNPSLYIYRENLIPSFFPSFLTSNFRGIESLASDPFYLINGDSDVSGTKYDIPVGNGYLFFFRGGTGTTLPFTTTSTPASGTLTITGSLNQGNVTVTNWYNESLGQAGLLWTTANGGDLTIQGMNLVGNPYPSTIDWSNFNTGNSIISSGLTGEITLLNPGTAAGSGNYTYYIPPTPTSPGLSNMAGYAGLIASGEGFFVQSTTNNATLTFTENAKTNTQALGSSLFLANKRTLSTVVPQQIRLEMLADSINLDATLINFNPDSKAAFNIKEDAHYRTGTGRVNLSSLSSDNVLLAINQLPLAQKGDTISLNVGANAAGDYVLKAETITGIPQQYDVWLHDAVTRDSVNMQKTSSYNFTITSDTTTAGSKRFKLVVKPNPALIYKLISFNGQKTDKRAVQLTWNTQNEANYTQFSIERSNDGGKTFSDLGDMTSTGAGVYNFTDPDPLKGDNEYYLKTVDYFGNVTLSNIVDEQFQDNGNDKGTSLTLFPNPVVNTINLTIVPKSQGKTTYGIMISNSTGMVVKSATTSDVNWQNNVSNLLPGNYLVQVVDNKNNSIIGQLKFVKL